MTRPAPAPHEIILEDFTAPWVIGRRLIRKGGIMVVEIATADNSGFWVHRLTKSMTKAQRSTPRDQGEVPKAFRLFPVVAIYDWAYYNKRPEGQGG